MIDYQKYPPSLMIHQPPPNQILATDQITTRVIFDFKEFEQRKFEIMSLAYANRFFFFNQLDWYASWYKTMHKLTKLQIIIAEKNGVIVGVLPLWKITGTWRYLGYKILEPIAGNRSDYQLPLIKVGLEKTVWQLLFTKAIELSNKHGLLYLPHLPMNSPANALVRDILIKDNYIFHEEISYCPFLTFDKSYELTANKWSKSHTADVRRQTKRLFEKGNLTLWIATTEQEIKNKIEDFFATYQKKWQTQNKPDQFADQALKQQMFSLIDRQGTSCVHFSTLQIDGQDISYHFGFKYAGWLLWYRPTYKIEYENYSPGKVHLDFLIKHGIKEGWQGIDFLQGEEKYKFQWTDQKENTVSWLIATEKLNLAFIWLTKIKPFLIKNLGGSYLQWKILIQKYRQQ